MPALLLDTHALLWWLAGDKHLSKSAHAAIEDEANEIYISAVTAWEIATKIQIGKLLAPALTGGGLTRALVTQGFHELPVSIDHGERAGSLAGEHRDPFDRMLIAQAQAEAMTIVSNEAVFDGYGVTRIW